MRLSEKKAKVILEAAEKNWGVNKGIFEKMENQSIYMQAFLHGYIASQAFSEVEEEEELLDPDTIANGCCNWNSET